MKLKSLIFAMTLAAMPALAGCDTEAQKQHKAELKQFRQEAWAKCIEQNGVPIESWLGAPAMAECQFKEVEK